MTTTQNIHDLLPHDGVTDTAVTLKAVKAAVYASWPALKVEEYATGVATLAESTFVYSLSALTDLTEWGVAQVYVAQSDDVELRLRGVSQYRDGTTWYLKFSPELVSAHAGMAVNVRYQRRITPPTSVTEALDAALPVDYLTNYVMGWYARYSLSEAHTDQRIALETTMLYDKLAEDAKRHNMVLPIRHSVPHIPAKDDLP